jgi:hypothetical protein
MESVFYESIIDLIPHLSAAETNEKLDLSPIQTRIKDIVSKMMTTMTTKTTFYPSFSFPSLNIRSDGDHTDRNEKKDQLLETFSHKLSNPVHFDHESVVDAPKTLLNNISLTFVNLLDSRMNNSILAITKHASMPNAERNAIVDILTSSSLKRVTVTSVMTRFRVHPSRVDPTTSPKPPMRSVAESYIADDEDSIRIPIVFDCSMQLLLFSKESTTVHLHTHGSIIGTIGSINDTDLSCTVAMSLDTSSLLQILVTEAHRVCNILITVASALALSELSRQSGTSTIRSSTCTNISSPSIDEDQEQEQSGDAKVSLSSSATTTDTNALEPMQQDMIDMPPPPPRR